MTEEKTKKKTPEEKAAFKKARDEHRAKAKQWAATADKLDPGTPDRINERGDMHIGLWHNCKKLSGDLGEIDGNMPKPYPAPRTDRDIYDFSASRRHDELWWEAHRSHRSFYRGTLPVCWQAFNAIVRILRHHGFRVGIDEDIRKRHPRLSKTHRHAISRAITIGGTAESPLQAFLEAKLEVTGIHVQVQFYQNYNRSNTYGGQHDFDKKQRCPYLLYKKYQLVHRSIVEWAVSAGYKRDAETQAQTDADEFRIRRERDRCQWRDFGKYFTRDGYPVSDGMRAYVIDYKTRRLMRGVALAQGGDQWKVYTDAGKFMTHENVRSMWQVYPIGKDFTDTSAWNFNPRNQRMTSRLVAKEKLVGAVKKLAASGDFLKAHSAKIAYEAAYGKWDAEKKG